MRASSTIRISEPLLDVSQYGDDKPSAGQRLARVTWNSGVVCMLLSAIAFTTMSIGVQQVTRTIPIFEVIFARGICGALLTILAARATGVKPLFGRRRNWPLNLLRAILGASSMGMSYFAIYYLSLHDFTALYFSNPAFTVVLAWITLGEKVSGLTAVGFVLALVGLPVLTQPPFVFAGQEWTENRVIGVSVAVVAGFLAASAIVVVRMIKNEASLSITMWYHTISGVSSTLPLALAIPSYPKVPHGTEIMWLGVVVVMSFTGQIVQTRGFLLMPAGKASALNLLQVALAFAYDVLWLQQGVDLTSVLGALLIGTGVVIVGASKEQIRRRTMSELGCMMPDNLDADDSQDNIVSKRGSLDGM